VQEGKRLGPIGKGFEDDEKVGIGGHIGHHPADAENQIGGGRIVRDEALQASIEPMPQDTRAKFAIMYAIMYKEQKSGLARWNLIRCDMHIGCHLRTAWFDRDAAKMMRARRLEVPFRSGAQKC
jgi:hypothetical protein